MRVLVTGAAGMIGRKLTARLVDDGTIAGSAITALDLHDIVPPDQGTLDRIAVTTSASDLAAPGEAEKLVAARPDVIFHLAGVVSGEAEADFELGYRVNLDGTRALFDAVRQKNHHPRVVFSSSIAVFGAPFPDIIPDEFHPTPLTSYGTQKLICEALLADYTRRGFFDGIGIRLPTINVRPGKPNKAASGFFSGIIREPLAGHEAILPVSDTVRHWHASPRAAILCAGAPVTSWPPTSTRPAVGLSKPVTRLMVVVLPEPLGPMRPRMSPRSSVKETSSTARRPAKSLVRPLTVS